MMQQLSWVDLVSIAPIAMLTALACLALVFEVTFKEKGRIATGLLMVIGVMVTGLMVLNMRDLNAPVFFGSLSSDAYTQFFSLLFMVVTAAALFLEISDPEVRCGEAYCLTLLAACGMVIMSAAVDLMTLLLGLEVMSLSIYALVGIRRTDLRSNEASLKYFLLGAVASAIFLYGLALCFGATGSIYLKDIAAFITQKSSLSPLLMTGLVLVLAGFAFKVALVPFHMWTPDVYEGAPTAVTAFMATGVKAAGFAAFFRVFLQGFGDYVFYWQPIVACFAVLTMTLGNLTALAQTSLKRMLSYSSIAHAGYILLALVACDPTNRATAVSSAMFYLLAYAFMTFGAFTVLFLMDLTSDGDDHQRFSGLGWKRPFVGLVFSVCLLSLAGIPPMVGFAAKYFVFSAVLQSGHIVLLIIAVLNSLVSLYFYLRPLVWMYMEGSEESEWRAAYATPVWVYVVLLWALLGTVSSGLLPSAHMKSALLAANALSPKPAVSTAEVQ